MSATTKPANTLKTVSEFVADLSWDGLPNRVQDRTRTRLLDGIGATLGGWQSEHSMHALKLARSGVLGGGSASHWLAGSTGAADAAAFVNAVTMHAILHEDGGPGGHPSSHTIPAAVAVAESEAMTGEDLLTGIAAGYEIQARMGHLTGLPEARSMRGTVMVGCFGAAVATAKTTRQGSESTRNALSLAASVAFPAVFGPLVASGGQERVVQLGANTRNGVLAGLLALQGWAGMPNAWDGEDGFFHMLFGQRCDRPEIAVDLGTTWRSEANISHPYPTGGGNIGTMYAATKLARENEFDVADIRHIEILHPWWRKNPMYIHKGPFRYEEDIITSAPFGVACSLLYESADWESLKRGMDDPRTTELVELTEVLGIAGWTLVDGVVTVTLKDGRTIRADAADIPENALKPSWDELVAGLADRTRTLDDGHREEIVRAVENVTEPGGVENLGAVLRRPVG